MRRRAGDAVLIAAIFLMTAAELGHRVLATNDEARFPLLARDILARGDWWWPRVGDAVYHNKPPLFAWLVALASWPFGDVTPFTAALPSAAAGVVMAALVHATGRRLFDSDAGRYAALALVTTQGYVLHARVPMPDMLLACCGAGALWALAPMTRGRSSAWWAAFYGFVAAGVWVKGLPGLLPLGLALAWAAIRGEPEHWRRLRMGAGLPLLAALLAPLLLRAVGVEGAAVRAAVVGDQLRWFAPGAPTIAALVAPAQSSFGVLFPWVLLLPFALWQAARFTRGTGTERDGVLLLLVWAAGTLVAVGLSHQQRVRYYVPLVPPAALLLGWWVASAVVRGRDIVRIPMRTYAAGGGALALLTVTTLLLRGRLPRDVEVVVPGSVLEVAVTVGALALVTGALALGVARGRLRGVFAAAWLGSAVLLLCGYHWEIARRNAANDYAGLARRLAPQLEHGSAVATLDVPDLPLAFYLRRPVVVVRNASEIGRLADARAGTVVVLTETALGRLPSGTRASTLATDRLAFRRVAVARLERP